MIYSCELTKKNEVLYTAWWFDNGNYRTIRQLNWRWKVLRGANDFSLINVTAGTKEQLEKEVFEILSKVFLRKY